MEWESVSGLDGDLGEFVRRGLALRAGPGVEVESWAAHLESMRASGHLVGLRGPPGAAVGAAVFWDPAPRLGAHVHLLYAEGRWGNRGVYEELLDLVRRRYGEIAFLPGPLAGLTAEEEAALLTARGFARYGRSEMVLPPEVELPPPEPGGPTVRPLRPEDEAALGELHRNAYHDRFDRYLFLEDPDETRDSAREVRDLLSGRWGPFHPRGSVVLEEDRHLSASVIVVNPPDRALIADVAVDPARQGRRLGYTVLLACLRELRASGCGRIVLNVTEGNERAVRLYRRLGFVRSLGPSQDWYQTSVIPVRP